ncbi:hypothetical protein B0T09DRAFT_188145 [Sordaria sp. MPI-SDFR-AT-0083]|nr:hypothetical protein B0T09DRAFT_188145 [Sordaria sp. MPI-SDFR-AT-0083]
MPEYRGSTSPGRRCQRSDTAVIGRLEVVLWSLRSALSFLFLTLLRGFRPTAAAVVIFICRTFAANELPVPDGAQEKASQVERLWLSADQVVAEAGARHNNSMSGVVIGPSECK